jgi:hypothetical protein
MNIANFRPMIESAIRLVLVFFAGKVGFEASEAQLGTTVTFITFLVLGALSLWWSKASDAAQIKKVTGQ